MTNLDPSTSGRLLAGRFRLGPRRGSGLDIAIFEAVDLREQRPVAIKIIHPDLCAVEGFIARFTETMATAATVQHPNLARLYDWGTAEWDGRDVVFTASENLTGGSLRDLLDRGRQLSPSQGLMVGLDVCKALDAAHRVGLVHADVRPTNLVFGSEGRVRLTDLGLAHLIADQMWADPPSIPLGRARFAAPEQSLGRPTEAKSDVYALCLSLLESMTGVLPFVGDSTVATLANRVDKLMPVSADLGPLASVLERAGRPDPSDRWSAAEFGRALVQAAEKLPRPAPLPLLSAGLFADATAAGPTPGQPTPVPLVPPAPASADAGAGPSIDAGASAAHEPNRLASVPMAASLPEVPLPTEPVPPSPPAAPPAPSPVAMPAPPTPSPVPTAPPIPDVVTSASSAPVAPPANTVPAAAAAAAAAADVAVSATSPVPPPPPHDVEPPLLREPRSRRKLVALVVVLIIAAAIGGTLAWFFGRTESNAVPEMVGLEEGAALNAISEFGWNTSVIEEASDDVEPGVVIRTDPEAGVTLDEGADLLLVISSGPAPRVIPEITGLTVDAATTVLAELGLTVQLGGEQADEVAPAGTILSWVVPAQPSLVAGDTVVRGTALVVTLSSGPAPRVVPDLTGFSLADATAQLQQLGLVVAQLPDEYSATVPAGGIARQDPVAGTEVPRDSTVNLVVSLGPDLVTVPPLAELTVQQVTDALTAAGLVLGDVLGDPAGVAVLAEVDGAPLVANVTLPRGTAIDVTFEVPPPPSTEPPVDPAATTTVVP